jgi:hypothetical protein
MTKIKGFLQFIKEALEDQRPVADPYTALDPEEVVKFHYSSEFINTLFKLQDEYKVAELFLKIRFGVQRKNLVRAPADYFDINDEGIVSFLKPRNFNEPDLWNNNRRISVKINKALREVFNETYINHFIKQTDIDAILNKLASMAEGKAKVVELRGEEILRAYNYTKEVIANFGYTCANFYQNENRFGGHSEPKLDEYDVYVKNPENCGAVVVIEEGKIVGRRSFQQGPNVIDTNYYKKDKIGTIWGNYYGLGGTGSKYDNMIKNYLKEKYNADQMRTHKGFIINLETRFKRYCPFDSMYVDFKNNLLADDPYNYTRQLDEAGYKNLKWEGTYHAHCPDNLVQQRLKEESEKNKVIEPTN